MDNLEKSIIVAAHPDDENLWFSSILSKVDWIVFCYLTVESKSTWTEGRAKSLLEYPQRNIICLELTESEVFWGVDWSHPIRTEYGLKITAKQFSDTVYRMNFEVLKNRLRETLRGYQNVFTHNPWGEYGHVEHVQVYCAVKSLQEEMGFKLWFTNYVSNKSLTLMSIEYPQIGPYTHTRKTNKQLAISIAEIYKRNKCWTWYDDYEWCEEETFIKAIDANDGKGRYGSLFPVNVINVRVEQPYSPPSGLHGWQLRVRRKLRRLLMSR